MASRQSGIPKDQVYQPRPGRLLDQLREVERGVLIKWRGHREPGIRGAGLR